MLHLTAEPPAETLWAVIVGAVLATAGGFAATQLEGFVRRRERERSAALLFGEILAALETITQIADQTRRRGDPYGPVTMRLLRAARRETEAYERNRGSLYDLRDAGLRIQIHVVMVQLSLGLEGVFDACHEIGPAAAALASQGDEAGAAALRDRLETLAQERDTAFAYAVETVAGVKALIARLEPLGGVNFQELKRFSGAPEMG
jgi:hypothetical protein